MFLLLVLILFVLFILHLLINGLHFHLPPPRIPDLDTANLHLVMPIKNSIKKWCAQRAEHKMAGLQNVKERLKDRRSYFDSFLCHSKIFSSVLQHPKKSKSRDKLQKRWINCELSEVKRKKVWHGHGVEKRSTLYPGDHAHQECHTGKQFFKSVLSVEWHTGSKVLHNI